ncbi:MAG: hypothetical protein GY925_02135 [Actinomycetia bacterium]|nr:hypothetical protein [Actinomycetes bacterium]
MTDRRDELRSAFTDAGIAIAADGTTVTSVASEASFELLSSKLKSSMPTASMTVKRVVGANG